MNQFMLMGQYSLVPKLVQITLLSLCLIGCAARRGVLKSKLSKQPPSIGGWSIKSIDSTLRPSTENFVEELKANNAEATKEKGAKSKEQSPPLNIKTTSTLNYQNGLVIKTNIYSLQFIDSVLPAKSVFQFFDEKLISPKFDPDKLPPQDVSYLFRGSPCVDCDRLQSVYLINPARGGHRLIFMPGKYFTNAGKKVEGEKHLYFEGRLFYGMCHSQYPNGIFIQKTTYVQSPQESEAINTSKKVESYFINPFQTSYPSQKLSSNEMSEIIKKAALKYRPNSQFASHACLEMEQKEFFLPDAL